MRIIIFKRLGIAMFATEGVNKFDGKVIIEDENGEKLTSKLHYNKQIKTINGEAQLPTSFFNRKSDLLEITFTGKRYQVGEVMMTDIGIITRNTNSNHALLRLCQISENALKENAEMKKRIQTLEKAYYGSDITELK